MSMLIMMISMMTMIIASIISKKTFMDREKNSPFECGFEPKSSARIPFSIQFFLVAIIFLIFDVEITLIFPFIVILKSSNLMITMLTLMIFLTILIIGLYHEWAQGALNWSI
uniref:NADH-ubiquinone oxidoreductase chain 3 n=1 Tax=Heterocerus parallelus TaxID=1587350 RepID=A0A343C1I3_9COLE|nr:NADH dehydrogenase subunit 3 [Heterocerus parallelus]